MSFQSLSLLSMVKVNPRYSEFAGGTAQRRLDQEHMIKGAMLLRIYGKVQFFKSGCGWPGDDQ